MFNGKLYKQQAEAAEFLVNKRRVLLAWEQGTGKTIISLASIERLFSLGKISNALVLAPSSIAWQWLEKSEQFTNVPVRLAEAKKPGSRIYSNSFKGITVVPYSLFRNDFDAININSFDVTVADEAQEFKNNKSKTAKLLKAYNRKHDPTYRWALTGTAVSNRLEELYSIFFWIDKEFLPPWPEFEKNHIIRNDFTNAITSYKNLKPLYEHLIHRMDRKTHKDMEGQLPSIVTQHYKVPKTVEYHKAESALLDALDNMARDLVLKEDGELPLRTDPAVSKAFMAARKELSAAKLQSACKLIDTLLDESELSKVVLFSYHKQPLYDLFEHYGDTAVQFTGDQSQEEKREAVHRLTGSSRILLASNAGYSGLDLGMANHVIHLDVPFSHSIHDQRTKRITRLSSSFKTVVAHYLLMEDSIEHYFYDQVLRKGELASAVQEGTQDELVIKPQSLRQWIRTH